MTSLNMVVQAKARAGYVIADSAVTAVAGDLLQFCGKILIGTGRFPYAIGVSGSVHPLMFGELLGAADPKNLKQLARRLPAVMRATIVRTLELQSELPSVMMMLRGVAWDFGRNRPVGFVMVS